MKTFLLLIIFLTFSYQAQALVVSDVGAELRNKREMECLKAKPNSEKAKECKMNKALENDLKYKALNKQYGELIKENLSIGLSEQNKYKELKEANTQKQKDIVKEIDNYRINFTKKFYNTK